jgi:hypothetical protein
MLTPGPASYPGTSSLAIHRSADFRVTNPQADGSPVTVPRLWGLRLQGVDIE